MEPIVLAYIGIGLMIGLGISPLNLNAKSLNTGFVWFSRILLAAITFDSRHGLGSRCGNLWR
jgi:hypothetical protein